MRLLHNKLLGLSVIFRHAEVGMQIAVVFFQNIFEDKLLVQGLGYDGDAVEGHRWQGRQGWRRVYPLRPARRRGEGQQERAQRPPPGRKPGTARGHSTRPFKRRFMVEKGMGIQASESSPLLLAWRMGGKAPPDPRSGAGYFSSLDFCASYSALVSTFWS